MNILNIDQDWLLTVCENFNVIGLLFASGDGRASIDEVGSPRFLLLTSACWNGIAMGAIDIARRHVTTKEHADIGMRVADYPTIQVSKNQSRPQSSSLLRLVKKAAKVWGRE